MTNNEKENFLRRAILIVDHSKDALTSLVDLDLANKNTSFEDFININQHEIYHLCYSSKCCRCLPGYTPPRQRVLHQTQLELLFEKITKLPGHTSGWSNDFCCSKAISGLSPSILDLTLAKCLLINFSSDVFWHSCLNFTGKSFEDFLTQSKHTLYHLWQPSTTCCHCPQGYIFPTRNQQIPTSDWNTLFRTVSTPCTSHRKRTHTGHTNCICTVSAVAGIQHNTLDPKLQRVILQHCCDVRHDVDSLASIRNNDYGHAKKGQISDVEYNKSVSDIEKHIINIARICKKETQFRHKIQEAKHGALDEKLLMQYRNNLLEFISRQNDLNESISEICSTLGRKIASKTEQIPDKMQKIIDESVQQIEYNLETRIKQGLLESSFLRQKDLTTSEIESYLEEETFVETKAVRKCLKKAEIYDVFIISGTSGTGKSRIGLEILRQFGNKYKDFDLIKTINLKEVNTLLTVNRKFILLLDKVFRKTQCLGNDDNAIFHSLYVATSKGRVKLICTVPSDMKGKMGYIYQSQRLFQSFYEIDLNLPNFQMSYSEKETLLKHYCNRYNIHIVDEKNVENLKDNEILNENVPIKLCTKIIKQIVDTGPFMGYPKTCYMFTSRRVYTRLGLWFFVHPTEFLVKDINELRDTGNSDEGKKLSYMTLCYIFLIKDNCLSKHSIDSSILSPITSKCYGSQALVPQFKLKQTAEEMVGIYLSYNEKNGTYSYQHPVVGEAVAISLNQVDPELVINVIDIDFIGEVVRLEHYEETNQKPTMKVPRQYYVNLISRLVSIFNTQFQQASFEFVSKLSATELLRQNDNEFLSQLFTTFANINRNETMEIRIQDKEETLMFFFPAVFLLYITRQSGVDKVVASLLYFLNDKVQTETDKSKLKACHIAFEASFIYLCENENRGLKLELLSGFKDDLKVECDISFCLKMALKRGNTDTAVQLIVTQSKHLDIVEFVMTIDDVYLQSTEEVLSVALNYPTTNHTEREHLVNLVLNNAWDKFNIDNVVKSACRRHLTGLLISLIERCPNGLTDFSCNLIISESCEHEWHEVVRIILGERQLKRDQLNKIFIAACCSGWVPVLDWLQSNVDKRLLDIKTATDESFRRQQFEIVFRLLEGFVADKFNITSVIVPVISKYGFQSLVEWLLINVDNKFSTNRDKDNNDDIYSDLHILKCVFGLLQHPCFDTTILNTVNTNIKNKTEIWLTGNVCTQVDQIRNLMYTSCKQGYVEIVHCLLDQFDHTLFDINQVIFHSVHQDTVMMFLPKVDREKIDFLHVLKMVLDKTWTGSRYDLVKYLLGCVSQDQWDLTKIILQLPDFNITDVTPLLLEETNHSQLNDTLRCGVECDNLNLVKWLLNNVEHKTFEFNTVINAAISNNYWKLESKTILFVIQHINHSLIDIQKVMNTACQRSWHCQTLVKWIVDNVDHQLLDFNAAIDNLLPSNDFFEQRLDLVLHILQSVDHSLIDMKKLMNTASIEKAIRVDPVHPRAWYEFCQLMELCYPKLVKWIVENVDHKLLDLNTAIDNLLSSEANADQNTDLVLHILQHIDHSLIDMKKVMNTACELSRRCELVVMWIVESVDHTLLDLNTAIDNLMSSKAYADEGTDLVLHILQHVDHSLIDMKKVMNTACEQLNIYFLSLQLSSPYDKLVKWMLRSADHKLLDFNTAIDSILSSNGNPDTVIDLVLHILQDVDNSLIDFQRVMTTACECLHQPVVELLLDNVHHKLLNVNTSVDTLFHSDKKESAESFLTNVLQKIVTETNIKDLMEKACHIGYSNVIWWLLRNKDLNMFDLKIVMNQVCYHGHHRVIEWLWNNTAQNKYDMRTAMIKACRGHNTLSTVMWLWHNVSHKDLDMESSLYNACRHGNDKVVEWMLTNLPHHLFDIGIALFNACENGRAGIVHSLLFHIDRKSLDIQTALEKACKNINYGLSITETLLRETADSVFDIYRILRVACKYQRTDIVRVVIEKQDKSVDFRTILNCVVDMKIRCEVSNDEQKNQDEMEKKNLMLWILPQTSPSLIDVDKVLVEVCTKGWMDVMFWIWENVDHTLIDIKTGIDIACQHGRQKIVRWALRNIDSSHIRLSTLMTESCGFGWIEEVKWLWQNIDHEIFDIRTSMNEACAYRRYEVVDWLITKIDWNKFDVNTVLIESCKYGWLNVVTVVLEEGYQELLDLQSAVTSACVEGHTHIVELLFSRYSHDVFDLHQLEVNGYSSNKEVIKFLLGHYFNHKDFNLSVILMKASGHGWTDMVKDILENSNDLSFDWTAALTNACENGETDVVKLLINRIDPTEVNMKLAMIFVCRYGWEETATLLLDRVDHSYLGVNDAMQEACHYGEKEIVELLFNKCSRSQFDVKTAVNMACKNQFNEDLILWILERCNPSNIDFQNLSSKSAGHGWDKIVTFLHGLTLEK